MPENFVEMEKNAVIKLNVDFCIKKINRRIYALNFKNKKNVEKDLYVHIYILIGNVKF